MDNPLARLSEWALAGAEEMYGEHEKKVSKKTLLAKNLISLSAAEYGTPYIS